MKDIFIHFFVLHCKIFIYQNFTYVKQLFIKKKSKFA